MRLSSSLVPVGLLLAYVPLSVVYSLSAIQAVVFLLGLFLLRTKLVLGALGKKTYQEDLVLETITLSHYVEKVRWCLDHLKTPYHEEENVGILGIFLLGRRVPQLSIPALGITISNSSDILRYLLGKYSTDPQKADFLRPTPESLSLESKFDRLGELFRVVVYNKIFSSTAADRTAVIWAVWGLRQPNIPTWQKVLLRLLTPVLSGLVIRRLRVGETEAVAAIAEAETILAEVSSLLADGRPLLLSTSQQQQQQPSYIDFHFAAMVGLLLLPEQYAGSVVSRHTRQVLIGAAASFTAESGRVTASPAGQFALRLYKEYRCLSV